jgi:hypothetical protein
MMRKKMKSRRKRKYRTPTRISNKPVKDFTPL